MYIHTHTHTHTHTETKHTYLPKSFHSNMVFVYYVYTSLFPKFFRHRLIHLPLSKPPETSGLATPNLEIVCLCSCSVMSNSLWPHGLQPTKLHCFQEVSKQGYWSGLPFPPLGDLPNPGIKPTSPADSALAGRFLTTELPGKPKFRAAVLKWFFAKLWVPRKTSWFPCQSRDSLGADSSFNPSYLSGCT